MNAIPSLLESAQTRTLANVLLELRSAQTASSKATFAFYAAEARGDREATDHYSDLGAKWDDRALELEAEAKAMIEAATGVPWKLIEDANL